MLKINERDNANHERNDNIVSIIIKDNIFFGVITLFEKNGWGKINLNTTIFNYVCKEEISFIKIKYKDISLGRPFLYEGITYQVRFISFQQLLIEAEKNVTNSSVLSTIFHIDPYKLNLYQLAMYIQFSSIYLMSNPKSKKTIKKTLQSLEPIYHLICQSKHEELQNYINTIKKTKKYDILYILIDALKYFQPTDQLISFLIEAIFYSSMREKIASLLNEFDNNTKIKWNEIIKGNEKDYFRLGKTRDNRFIALFRKNINIRSSSNNRFHSSLGFIGSGKSNNKLLKIVFDKLVNEKDRSYDIDQDLIDSCLSVLLEVSYKNSEILKKLINLDDYDITEKVFDFILNNNLTIDSLKKNESVIKEIFFSLCVQRGKIRLKASLIMEKIGRKRWVKYIKGNYDDYKRLAESNDINAIFLLFKFSENNSDAKSSAKLVKYFPDNKKLIATIINDALFNSDHDFRKKIASKLFKYSKVERLKRFKECIHGDFYDFVRIARIQSSDIVKPSVNFFYNVINKKIKTIDRLNKYSVLALIECSDKNALNLLCRYLSKELKENINNKIYYVKNEFLWTHEIVEILNNTKNIEMFFRSTKLFEIFIKLLIKQLHDSKHSNDSNDLQVCLFKKYSNLLIGLSKMDINNYKNERTEYGKYMHEVDTYEYSTRTSDNNLLKLINIKSKISNNLLHLVSKRPDVQQSCGSSCYRDDFQWYFQTISFKHQRIMAKKELDLRKNPKYKPAIFLEPDNWLTLSL